MLVVLDGSGAGTFRWEMVSPATGAGDDHISPRMHHAANWDRDGQRLLVYGGEQNGDALSDLWELRIRP
jgi:hypothetical protein